MEEGSETAEGGCVSIGGRPLHEEMVPRLVVRGNQHQTEKRGRERGIVEQRREGLSSRERRLTNTLTNRCLGPCEPLWRNVIKN